MKIPIGLAGKFGWDRAQSKAVNVPTPAAKKATRAIRNDLRPANFMPMRCERIVKTSLFFRLPPAYAIRNSSYGRQAPDCQAPRIPASHIATFFAQLKLRTGS